MPLIPSLLRTLFRENGARNVVTLFHSPTVASSVRLRDRLESALRESEDKSIPSVQTSDKFPRTKQAPFELDVVESPPTADQLKSIFDYVGSGRADRIVTGARSPDQAARILATDPACFQAPLVVDWNSGKAVVGADETELVELLRSIKSD